jgi:hypothetical protein
VAVRRAYEIPASLADALDAHFAGFSAPEGFPRLGAARIIEGPHDAGAALRVGAVLDVDSDRVQLWVSGLTEDEGEWVLPPDGFPGWMCRPGATFEMVGDRLSEGQYYFQHGTSLSDEELTGQPVLAP